MENDIVKDLIKKLRKCDDFHGRCDYLIEHSEITYLLEYLDSLKEEVEAVYSILEMQNKREYHSKFLKDFQKEHGKHVFPDHDEIYKRYDDYKRRCEKATKLIKENICGGSISNANKVLETLTGNKE